MEDWREILARTRRVAPAALPSDIEAAGIQARESGTSRAELSRRKFLRFLAGTAFMSMQPLAYIGCADKNTYVTNVSEPDEAKRLVSSASQAYNVFDLRDVAETNIPPAHWGYLQSGVNGDVTLRANEEAFLDLAILPRRLVNVSNIDTSVTLFGKTWETPIILCPAGSQAAFHPEGEIAVARAARNLEHLQILSTVSSNSIEHVTEARGEPLWYQLYPSSEWPVTEFLVHRAEDSGSPVLLLTVDQMGRRSDTFRFYRDLDDRDCSQCHAPQGWTRKPMFQGSGVSEQASLIPYDWDWGYLDRLRSITDMKIMFKGIETAHDAEQCLIAGVDGVVVSNHGGRGTESGRGTIESLPEIVAVLKGKMPILIDSGFRRGPDIFKALALGADAVGIGRPYLWGLGAFGQDGVEATLNILTADLRTVMRSAGASSIAEIDTSYITTV